MFGVAIIREGRLVSIEISRLSKSKKVCLLNIGEEAPTWLICQACQSLQWIIISQIGISR